MSKQSFTPGPWCTLPEECDRPYIRVRGTSLGMRYKIANVLTPAYEGVSEREANETRANARLIAAAPDLLAALVELVRQHKNIRVAEGYPTRESPATEAADAAISKALGDQP